MTATKGWNVLDVVLALLMLPFGIAMFLVERLVLAVAAIGALDLGRSRT